MTNTWKGFKEFIVFDKVQEDELVTSLYLKLKDDSQLPKAISGQFIAVRFKNGDEYTKIRQYTLSMSNKENYYRISIKKEENGEVSKILCDNVNIGDTLECTAPVGRFILKDGKEPLVLIGGGIGITPMLAMAYEAVTQNREIKLIYSLGNSNHHSFKDELDKLNKENSDLDLITIYTRPNEEDKLGKDFDLKGRITLEWMKENLPKNGDYYFCGPVPFMKAIYKNLKAMGIEDDKINYELFAPGEDITKE